MRKSFFVRRHPDVKLEDPSLFISTYSRLPNNHYGPATITAPYVQQMQVQAASDRWHLHLQLYMLVTVVKRKASTISKNLFHVHGRTCSNVRIV